MLAACDAAGIALVPLVAPTTPDERLARIGAQARGFVYTVSVTGTTGERAALDAGRRCSRGSRRTPRCRSRSASASPRPSRPPRRRPRAPTGVIVGSRLVRAAAEGEDVRALRARASRPRSPGPTA